MKNTWLVQRLDMPYNGDHILGKDNPFAFGGGLKNGGLSDEAMDLLRGIFSFDYMGAAEFEFGAVPKALTAIAQYTKTLKAWSFSIPLKDVEQHWRDKSKETPEGSAEIFVIAHPSAKDEVERRIKAWAAGKLPKDDEGYDMHLKEPTLLGSILRPYGDYTPRVRGWLELDNGFFFFVNREMWEGTCALFGVETPC